VTDTQNIVVRYLIATVGMFFVAVGIALSIISNLGTSPLSCPPYVVSLAYHGLSVGTWTWIINCVYMLLQLAVLRKNFKLKYFSQIIASILLGYMIDACMAMLGWLVPTTFLSRFGLILLSCLVTAFGVSLEVHCKAWMLSAEMLVNVLNKTFGWKFSRVKIIMDSLVVLLSSLFSLLYFGNPLGTGTLEGWSTVLSAFLGSGQVFIIGSGTLVSAFLAGWLMNFTDPLVVRLTKMEDMWKVH